MIKSHKKSLPHITLLHDMKKPGKWLTIKPRTDNSSWFYEMVIFNFNLLLTEQLFLQRNS